MKSAGIVLIEDHALVRHALGSALRGDTSLPLVAEFSSVAEGVRGCLKHRPQVVIVDWLLPDGKATDVVRLIAPKLPTTRFLIISSTEKEHVVREAVDVGAQGLVMKRSPYPVLLEAIQALRGGRSYYCTLSSRLLVESLQAGQHAGAKSLSPREREILRSVARGESLKSIAGRLELSPKTVTNQYAALKDKLGIHSVAGLVRYAVQHGLVEEF